MHTLDEVNSHVEQDSQPLCGLEQAPQSLCSLILPLKTESSDSGFYFLLPTLPCGWIQIPFLIQLTLPPSVQFSHSVMSNSLQLCGLQHARPPCPSPTPRAYSNSCPSSWWFHPAISSSVVPFSSLLQSFPASGNDAFKGVSSSHQVAKGLEFELQHQSFQWIFRTDVIAKESPNPKSWRFNPPFSCKTFVYWRPLLKVFVPFVVNLEIYPYSRIRGVVFSRSVVSDSLWPHGLQPPRRLCPWGFSRQEHWSGLLCPSPGDLPDPGIEPTSLALPGRFFTTEPPRRFFVMYISQ